MAIDTIPANDPNGSGVQIPSSMVPLVRPHARKLMDVLYKFVHEECIPAMPVYHAQMGKGKLNSLLIHRSNDFRRGQMEGHSTSH